MAEEASTREQAPLAQLRQYKRLRDRLEAGRDAAIKEAGREGHSHSEIAIATGISRSTVQRIVAADKAERDGAAPTAASQEAGNGNN